MTQRIFVTATNTDIGKTYATKLLLESFSSLGFRVGVFKPIETGVIDGNCIDGMELLRCVQKLNKDFNDIRIDEVVPIQYELPAAPFIASKGALLDFKKLDVSIEKLENYCDILIIEGAGGLYVPIDENIMMIDLIKYFNATTLLITHCSLGCINDTLLSKKALEDYNIDYLLAFNCRKRDSDFNNISEPYFKLINQEVLKIDNDIDKICLLLKEKFS